jgi:hypothetical protein
VCAAVGVERDAEYAAGGRDGLFEAPFETLVALGHLDLAQASVASSSARISTGRVNVGSSSFPSSGSVTHSFLLGDHSRTSACLTKIASNRRTPRAVRSSARIVMSRFDWVDTTSNASSSR